jgi:hypothetical protein
MTHLPASNGCTERILANPNFIVQPVPIRKIVWSSCHSTDEDADVMRGWERREVITQFDDRGVSGES